MIVRLVKQKQAVYYSFLFVEHIELSRNLYVHIVPQNVVIEKVIFAAITLPLLQRLGFLTLLQAVLQMPLDPPKVG